MSVSPTPSQREDLDLRFLRDDGHLSDSLGRLVAGAVPPLLPTLTGAMVLAVLMAAGLAQLPGITLFAPATALLLSGAASGHPHDGRFDWMVPPVLRATEYLYLLVLGLGSGVPGPLVFVLLATIVLHHGDVMQRVRCGAPEPVWIMRAMFGWDGRMLLVAAVGVLGWLPFGYGLLTGYLAVLLVWEGAAGWLATPISTAAEGPRNDDGGASASAT